MKGIVINTTNVSENAGKNTSLLDKKIRLFLNPNLKSEPSFLQKKNRNELCLTRKILMIEISLRAPQGVFEEAGEDLVCRSAEAAEL